MAQRGRPFTFKQHEPTSVSIRYGKLFLEQHGKLFTYAEHNKTTDLWSPPPRLVDETMLAEKFYRDEIFKLNKEMKRIKERLEEINTIICGDAVPRRPLKEEMNNGEQDKSEHNRAA